MSAGPLDGVRVLDLTAYAVGPYCGVLLAQLGADVTRVDPPYGDPIRGVQPTKHGEPTTYMSTSLGKRSVELDLKDPAQQRVAVGLAAEADVVIENARAGTLERLGLGYDQLREVNPRLVYCASSSFGDSGPLRSMGSTDPQGQAFSGFAAITGPTGEGPELLRYVALVDLSTSMYLAQAVLIGLHARNRSGRGQYIQTSQFEASVAVQATRLGEFFVTGVTPEPHGSGTAALVPSGIYRAQDGADVALTARTDAEWAALRALLGLTPDERLDTHVGRVAHRGDVDAAVGAAVATRPAAWWAARLPRAGVPCVRPRTLEDEPELHAHFAANEHVVRVPHPVSGTVRVGGPPWRFERSAVHVRGGTLPGTHTREVLAAASEPAPVPPGEHGADGPPLAGLTVVDATQGIAGPYASYLLRTLGAEVIKLEPPGGDWLRTAEPQGAAARLLNRGKRSLTLDLHTPGGRDVLLRLLRGADVFLHDLTAEQAAERGLAPARLRDVNPALVDCSVTPLGEVGPWAGRPASELEVQALSGLHRYLGELGGAPVRIGADVAGILGGCTALQAVLAALLARGRAGGQHAAVSELGALMAINTVMLAALDGPDAWEGFHCNAATDPPDHAIETADGRIYYGPPLRSEDAWRRFCEELGADELLTDPRFATRAQRMPNMPALRRALEPYFRDLSSAEVTERVVRSDGITVPVNDYEALAAHPQTVALGLLAGGALAPPWRRRDAPFAPLTESAPEPGEDGAAVLERCGFRRSEIEDLVPTERPLAGSRR
jgi:CoA:oxalate CoA-transferase